MPHKLAVIRIDGDGIPGAADRDIELLAVDEFRRKPSIDIDNDVIDGRALRRVRSRGVPVIDVAETVGCDAQLPSTV